MRKVARKIHELLKRMSTSLKCDCEWSVKEMALTFSEEVQEETEARMLALQSQEQRQWTGLSDLLEAEWNYFAKCKDILEELRQSWPTR